MQRIRDYVGVIAWQAGIGYIGLWMVTCWALAYGPIVLGGVGCRPHGASIFFYWICDANPSFAMLARLANAALTVTVWTPVYVAATAVEPDAMAISAPILFVHVIGFPSALLASIRMMHAALAPVVAVFKISSEECQTEPTASGRALELMMMRHSVKTRAPVRTRGTFGLRGPARI